MRAGLVSEQREYLGPLLARSLGRTPTEQAVPHRPQLAGLLEHVIDSVIGEVTAAADAALAMAQVERRVRERYPMIRQLFPESGSPAQPQRWSRPDANRTPPDATAAPEPEVETPASPRAACPASPTLH